MQTSILTSVKKNLGIAEDYTVFDDDIIMHINTALATLGQLGVGPEYGFMIQDKTAVWADLIDDDIRLNPAKTYVYLRVKLLFDPPATSFAIASMERQIEQFEWRLNVQREALIYQDPLPPEVEEVIYDGGTP